MKKYKILILEGHAVQVLPFLESFHNMKNVETTIFCESRLSYGWFSRFPEKKIISPTVKNNWNNFHVFLCNYIETYPQDIIIPMINDSAEYLSYYKAELEKYNCIIKLPAYDIFMKAHDKELLMNLCKRLNIPHPKTSNPAKCGFENAIKYVGQSFLIKPNIGFGARGIKKINEDDNLVEIFENTVKDYGQSCLQEFIPQTGKQFKVQLYRDENGNILFSSCYEKCRYYPIDGGTSTCNRVILKEELFQLYSKILDELNWIGIADFDCIEDPRDGEIKLMEINPRMPGTIKATFIAGINVAKIIVEHSYNMKTCVCNYMENRILRNFATEIIWFLSSPDRWKTKPNWFNFFGENIYYVDGSFKDFFPFIGGFLGGVVKMLSPEFRKSKKK